MKYAILLDGSYLLRRPSGQGRLQAPPGARDVQAYCDRLREHPALSGLAHLRTLFYDSRPSSDSVPELTGGGRIQLARTEVHRRRSALLSQLELLPHMALRLGELSYEGYTLGRAKANEIRKESRGVRSEDLTLRLAQKGVDLRIGLDIARPSLRERVDVIVVVTGDSDFVPAFKFARREGVQVFLDYMGGNVKRELLAHADLVLRLDPEGPAVSPPTPSPGARPGAGAAGP